MDIALKTAIAAIVSALAPAAAELGEARGRVKGLLEALHALAPGLRVECGPVVRGQENRCEYHRHHGAFYRACSPDAHPLSLPPRDYASPGDEPIGGPDA